MNDSNEGLMIKTDISKLKEKISPRKVGGNHLHIQNSSEISKPAFRVSPKVNFGTPNRFGGRTFTSRAQGSHNSSLNRWRPNLRHDLIFGATRSVDRGIGKSDTHSDETLGVNLLDKFTKIKSGKVSPVQRLRLVPSSESRVNKKVASRLTNSNRISEFVKSGSRSIGSGDIETSIFGSPLANKKPVLTKPVVKLTSYNLPMPDPDKDFLKAEDTDKENMSPIRMHEMKRKQRRPPSRDSDESGAHSSPKITEVPKLKSCLKHSNLNLGSSLGSSSSNSSNSNSEGSSGSAVASLYNELELRDDSESFVSEESEKKRKSVTFNSDIEEFYIKSTDAIGGQTVSGRNEKIAELNELKSLQQKQDLILEKLDLIDEEIKLFNDRAKRMREYQELIRMEEKDIKAKIDKIVRYVDE